jgi:probable HAF family extracellular repeat protein
LTGLVAAAIFCGAVAKGAGSSIRVGPSSVRYAVTQLPDVNDTCESPPFQPADSYGMAVNLSGEVAGASFYCVQGAPDASYEAAVWAGAQPGELGTFWQSTYPLGWLTSAATINDLGAVAGWGSMSGFSGRHAFVFSGGTMVDLGTFAHPGPCGLTDFDCLTGPSSAATGINDAGRVVGWSSTYPSSLAHHAFLWDQAGMHDLGTLGGTNSSAMGINERDVVVGAADTLDGASHAFVVQNGDMADLGTLGGSTSSATAVNDRGQIVGVAQTSSGDAHAFLFLGGGLHDLGTLQGSSSVASDVNNRLQVVGSSAVAGDTTTHAFVWTRGVMQDLNALVPSGTPVLVDATAINDGGQIVANDAPALSPFGSHAYLLTPVSLPRAR